MNTVCFMVGAYLLGVTTAAIRLRVSVAHLRRHAPAKLAPATRLHDAIYAEILDSLRRQQAPASDLDAWAERAFAIAIANEATTGTWADATSASITAGDGARLQCPKCGRTRCHCRRQHRGGELDRYVDAGIVDITRYLARREQGTGQ